MNSHRMDEAKAPDCLSHAKLVPCHYCRDILWLICDILMGKVLHAREWGGGESFNFTAICVILCFPKAQIRIWERIRDMV